MLDALSSDTTANDEVIDTPSKSDDTKPSTSNETAERLSRENVVC
jgi:hypothetical protein